MRDADRSPTLPDDPPMTRLATFLRITAFAAAASAQPGSGAELKLVWEWDTGSAEDQTVRVAGETLRFRAGDRIHTENSYKYDVEEVLRLAAPAWTPLHVWSDSAERFSVFLFGC